MVLLFPAKEEMETGWREMQSMSPQMDAYAPLHTDVRLVSVILSHSAPPKLKPRKWNAIKETIPPG